MPAENVPSLREALREAKVSTKANRVKTLHNKLVDLHANADYVTKCLDDLEKDPRVSLTETFIEGLGELYIIVVALYTTSVLLNHMSAVKSHECCYITQVLLHNTSVGTSHECWYIT